MNARLRTLVLTALLASSVVARPVAAQDDASRSAARRLATTGVEAFQRDDYATAVDKLQRAYEIMPVPSIGLWLARALAKQGHLVAASERYLEVGRMSVAQGEAAVQQSAKKDAAVELEALLPKIPSIVVSLEGASAQEVTLSLDGAPLASALVGEERPVDPGKHHIEGRRGQQAVAVDVSVAQSDKKSAFLRFDAAATPGGAPVAPGPATFSAGASAPGQRADTPPTSASTRKILAWSALGVGAAGIVTGGITGALAIGKKGELDDSPDCEAQRCLRSTMQDELDSYSTLVASSLFAPAKTSPPRSIQRPSASTFARLRRQRR
jgi:hypothetical protein